MNTPSTLHRSIEKLYASALCLYPMQFRACYAEAMLQTLRDALEDSAIPKARLMPTLLLDLIQSLIKENLAVIADIFARSALLFNALILAALSTVLALGLHWIPQQVLRMNANDPQVELAGNAAVRLEHGAPARELVPADSVDIAASLSPFMAIYDEQGKMLASSAQLDGKAVAPPAGVFAYARQHGEERLTWAPRGDVRIASILRHVDDANGGFVLAGRNMCEIEAREDLTLKMAGLLWLAMIGIVAVGTLIFGWMTQPPKAHPSVA